MLSKTHLFFLAEKVVDSQIDIAFKKEV